LIVASHSIAMKYLSSWFVIDFFSTASSVLQVMYAIQNHISFSLWFNY
jgi:hypothetical protein